MDTGDDPRFAVVETALEDLGTSITHGHIKANVPQDEVQDALERGLGAVKALKYSYADPDAIVDMPEFEELVQAAGLVETLLGGQAFEDEIDEKPLAVARARWTIDTVRSLGDRLFLDADGLEVAVEARVGRVVSASPHPSADELQVTGVAADGGFTVVTNDLDVAADDEVGLALLEPSDLRGVVSTGMFLGGADGVLTDVEPDASGRPDVPDEAWHETRNMLSAYLEGA